VVLGSSSHHWGGIALLLAILATLAGATSAEAATPPTLLATWASEVFATSARLNARINPNGAATSYHFEYIPASAYEANLAAGEEGFVGATKTPPGFDPTVGSGTTPVNTAPQLITGLVAQTIYRYRAVAKNSAGSSESTPLTIETQGFGTGSTLLDGRGWEMVSPVDKNGGQVDSPESIAGGGVFQAATGGGAATFSSASSFGPQAQGAPQGSQYLSARAEGGWGTENITQPMLSGSYGTGQVGVPYQLFSEDLARSLMLNGRHCRTGGEEACPVANPPLAGSGAAAGYQNYYLREGDSFTALLDGAAFTHTSLNASHLDVDLADAAPDLRHVVLSSCAALTANATEAVFGEGCAGANLYEWAQGGGLSLINLLPGQTQGTLGAELAAPNGAISDNGFRLYFTLLEDGAIYLREGSQTKLLPETTGGGTAFQTASTDGSLAYFTRAGHLYLYSAGGGEVTDLTPSGGVIGVLGASADGSYVYYQDAAGVKLWHAGETTVVAAGAKAASEGDYPPASGTSRVSADGTRLAFLSASPLVGYDNTDEATGQPDSELYLYVASASSLSCISCNPTGERPNGPSSLPGAYANGSVAGSLESYRPRAMADGGRRLFFDSADSLALGDTNGQIDAYEWEAQGTGSCTRPGGCLALLSSGKDPFPSRFLDASADGADAYFLTARSLAPTDPGSVDLYDARVGGGLPMAPLPIPCEGDACQSLPAEPEDPAVTTLVSGPGNPPIRYPRAHRKQRKKQRHHGPKHKRREARRP
jgi:hypothetical protein